jgi:starch-binding outer membrane protein, SusD/RagB family
MNKIKKYLAVLLILGITSCASDFLDEEVLDSLTTTNAFTNKADFTASVNTLYALTRMEFYTRNDNDPMLWLYRTDVVFQIPNATADLANDIVPEGNLISQKWNNLYKIVAEANTILSRLGGSSMSAEDKTLFEAKAKFFRAFAYRALAYLYDGVPLITQEIVVEKVDFVRASKEEVLQQAISDLTFAAENLPGITAVADGEVSTLAAQHLLAEVYLAAGQYQNAVDAASVVIDDPDTDLMTNRFGSRSTVTPGDVYWDLFQAKNQNRKTANNKEAIWVIQIETDVTGGSAVSSAQTDSYLLERVHAPLMRDFLVFDPVQNKNVSPFSWPAGDYTGGRGVGFMASSPYFINNVWDDPDNDIRNANHNFVRKVKANNPASPLFGQEIDFHNLPAGSRGLGGPMTSGVPDRAFYPYQTKCTQPFNHPAPLYVAGSPIPYFLSASAGGTYTDQYMFRLAETYLLRAEGYLGLNMTNEAADDINVVRARSNAAAITGADVDLDFILDERMREFGVEEKRMLTLMRVNRLVERLQMCNPYYGNTAQPRHNTWPIPQGEINRNRGAVLEQNPDYVN